MLSLLGSFQATLAGKTIAGFESDRVRALLAYLAVECDRPHRRETLTGLLWPDWPDTSALTNLRNSLANLRKAIGDRETAVPAISTNRRTLQFSFGRGQLGGCAHLPQPDRPGPGLSNAWKKASRSTADPFWKASDSKTARCLTNGSSGCATSFSASACLRWSG